MNNSFSNLQSSKNILDNLVERFNAIHLSDEKAKGVESGYKKLDEFLGGFQKGFLYVIGARPSVGKTSFCISMVKNMILHKTNPRSVAYFSLQNASSNIMERLLSCTSEIFLEVISRGILYNDAEWEKLKLTGIDPLYNAPLYIDDGGLLTVLQIEEKCKLLIAERKLDIIFIDYLQLIKAEKSRYRDEEISKIMLALKHLAKNIDVPIVLISQLNRGLEKRQDGGRIPELYDLKDSGSIEEIADVVMFLFRPDYYNLITNEFGDRVFGETYLKIAKNRLGALDTFKFKALLQIQKFVDDHEIPSEYSDQESSLNKHKWSKQFDEEEQKFKVNLPNEESPF